MMFAARGGTTPSSKGVKFFVSAVSSLNPTISICDETEWPRELNKSKDYKLQKLIEECNYLQTKGGETLWIKKQIRILNTLEISDLIILINMVVLFKSTWYWPYNKISLQRQLRSRYFQNEDNFLRIAIAIAEDLSVPSNQPDMTTIALLFPNMEEKLKNSQRKLNEIDLRFLNDVLTSFHEWILKKGLKLDDMNMLKVGSSLNSSSCILL
eukprot:GHVH01003751.1.p1 GENE.GHVH01003751.1~~GHVH01003751.1.p1  ORF type:complete len:211 (+),score=23.87 GHVH01003751.1:178-810(+)